MKRATLQALFILGLGAGLIMPNTGDRPKPGD
jgi:hypothetical protein